MVVEGTPEVEGGTSVAPLDTCAPADVDSLRGCGACLVGCESCTNVGAANPVGSVAFFA